MLVLIHVSHMDFSEHMEFLTLPLRALFNQALRVERLSWTIPGQEGIGERETRLGRYLPLDYLVAICPIAKQFSVSPAA
jgi:hypothetical protein